MGVYADAYVDCTVFWGTPSTQVVGSTSTSASMPPEIGESDTPELLPSASHNIVEHGLALGIYPG